MYYSHMKETPPAQQGATPSAEELMGALLHSAHALEKRFDEALARVGLSGPKYRALTVLLEAGAPATLSECAEKMSCVRSNITQLMDRLEADGLVQRVGDVSDRRSVRAELSALGRERQAAGAVEVAKLQAEFMKSLSGIDHAALKRLLLAVT